MNILKYLVSEIQHTGEVTSLVFCISFNLHCLNARRGVAVPNVSSFSLGFYTEGQVGCYASDLYELCCEG